MRFARILFAMLIFCSTCAVMGGTPPPAHAAASLAIAPASWGVVGLDSNRVTDGPDTFMLGAVVTNTGTLSATNLVATWVWDSANANINLDSASANPITFPALAVGQHIYFYFNVRVTRTAAAYDTARRYHVEVSATGVGTISTPTPRELYVEHLVSQNRNSVRSISGATTVSVGSVYTYTLNGGTATQGYEQLVGQLNLPSTIFQVLNVQSSYSAPTGATNAADYADACGWDAQPTSPTYRSCIGPENFAGGKAGGDPIVVTYTVQIMNTGSATLGGLLYDFSGSSYHYNSDLGVTTLAVNAVPTAARIGNTAAAPGRSGGVDLQWTSATELDHLGFNVWRATTRGGPYTRVNTHLITALGAEAGGGNYRFHDPTGSTRHWYQVEAVDSHNGTVRAVPFPVGKALPALPAAPDLRQTAAEAAAFAQANTQALAAQPHPPLATTPYKLLVSHTGIVRVTYEQLRAAGVPLKGVDPDALALSTGPATDRVAVPLALRLATSGVFAPGDSFDFVATAAPSVYGDARAYYLALSSSGKRMEHAGTAWVSPPFPARFPSTLHLEENHLYWQDAPRLGAPQPEGPWYWAYALDTDDAFADLVVPDAAPAQPADLTLAFQGFTSDAKVDLDHHLAFYLNGVFLGERRWSGRDPQAQRFTLPAGLLQSGTNRLRLQILADTGAEHDGVYLGSADLSYTRLYQAAGDALRFAAPAGTSLVVPGFSGAAVLYDVTNPGVPVALDSATVAGSLHALIPGQGMRQLLAAGPSGLVDADSIRPVTSADFHQGGADYVVIAADSLVAAGQHLAALHAGEGMRTTVVPVNAIYDQFGTGVPDAATLATFLRFMQSRWTPAPRYVALLGSASYDAHNYLGLGNADLLPTGYVTTAFIGRTPSDVSLALASPASAAPARPFVALGRLPAGSPAEAEALVAKQAAYQATHHQWAAQATLVADQADAGSFDLASQQLARILAPLAIERVYESQYGGGTRDQIVNRINSGTALLNYYGHGSIDQWSAENIFNSGVIDTMINNPGRETFLTAMTCFNGAYDWALGSGIVNALVLKPQGGAIGGLGGSAISYPGGQHQLSQTFYTRLLAGARVGDALLAAYAATPDSEVVIQFHLIGDPALQVDLGQ